MKRMTLTRRLSRTTAWRITALVAVLFAAPHSVFGETISREQAKQLIQSGLSAFDEAIAAARENPALARQRWQDALSSFLAVRESGVRNAAIEFNIGNTYARLGDVGRAILHYRRAERINPRGRSLQINLDQVRQQVAPRITAENSGPLSMILGWSDRATLWERVWLTGAFTAVGWIGLWLGLRYHYAPVTTLSSVGIAVGLLVAASAIIELREDAVEPPVVLVSGMQTLRTGRGEGYEPAIKEQLGAGVEARVVQSRADWAEIRLGNGIRGWLPESAIERVE